MSHSVTDSTVLLGHGSGGQMMKRIIDEVFLDAFGSPELLEGNDAGVATLPASGRIAIVDRQLCSLAAVLPRWQHRPPRCMRNRQRRRDLGRQRALPIVRLYPRRGLSHG